MRIIHLSARDGGGGAFSAASRLHRSLWQFGVDSTMLVGRKVTDDPHTFPPKTQSGRLWAKLSPKADQLMVAAAGYPNSPHRTLAVLGTQVASRLAHFNYDILTLHWISGGFMSINDLVKLRSSRIVWRLADMWPFSGAEHYVGASKRFEEGYTSANRPDGIFIDLDRRVWRRKLSAFQALENLTVVAPSHWIADCARRSILFRNRRIEVIPTGLDLSFFLPMNRIEARIKLGLPTGKRIILYGASGALSDPRKGFCWVKAVLRKLDELRGSRDIALVVFGEDGIVSLDNHLDIEVVNLGVITDRNLLAHLYAAADVFLAPSEEENLANTVIESLASGTPVVAFDVGGMPDLLSHRQNGFLAAFGDVGALTEGLCYYLVPEVTAGKVQRETRQSAEEKFSLSRQRDSYIELYNDLVVSRD